MDAFPDHQIPPSFAEFANDHPELDYDQSTGDLFLYHGTNCYRRWEINRTGAIEPGRNHYSFFCGRGADAYMYARAASLRDMVSDGFNSLICEPVVLKVRFSARTWLQIDFIQELCLPEDDDPYGLSLAVLGPIPFANIVDILHCSHGRRLGAEAIRTFEDGTLMAGIRHLREKLCKRRADTWVLRNLGIFTRTVGTKLSGGEMPELTFEDNLRRLRQAQVKA